MAEINWIGMDEATQKARKRKNAEIRTCRYYLETARKNGRTEKSTTIRKWKLMLAEARAIEIEVS